MPLCNHCKIDKPDEKFYIYRPKKCKDCIILYAVNNPKPPEKVKEIKNFRRPPVKRIDKKFYLYQ